MVQDSITPVALRDKLLDLTKAWDAERRRLPSDKHVDGALLGNGDVGIVLTGPPERLRFSISKNDF